MLTKSDMTAIELANYRSHDYGRIDDCIRCLDCEIGVWNGHRSPCPVAH